MARLVRVRDGMGDSGSCVQAIDRNTGKVVGNKPMIGFALSVGSLTARSYSSQDYWLTTHIKEFLEVDEKKGYIKFLTENGSTYEFWK